MSTRRRAAERLFEGFFVYRVPPIGDFCPELAYRFDEDYSPELLGQLPKFCFPYDERSTAAFEAQVFTFTFTDIQGCLQYGFCRQMKPDTPASDSNCLCIVSYLPWFSFFHDVLRTLSTRLSDPETRIRPILEKLCEYNDRAARPPPGKKIEIAVQGAPKPLALEVPDENVLPKLSSTTYLSAFVTALSSSTIIQFFFSALAERRMIVCSSNLGLVTSCVHALQTLMFPFDWQHVYIPIMPNHLLDYCGAPVPFLVGVHASLIEQVRSMPLEEYVLLNVDQNSLLSPFDDLEDVPQELLGPLKAAIKKASRSLDDTIPRAFLTFFANVMAGYRNFLSVVENHDSPADGDAEDDAPQLTFDAEEFVNSKPKTWHQFLSRFVSTQMFQQFIDDQVSLALSNTGNDMFEDTLTMVEQTTVKQKTRSWKQTLSKVKTRVSHKVSTQLKKLQNTHEEDGNAFRAPRKVSDGSQPLLAVPGDPIRPPRRDRSTRLANRVNITRPARPASRRVARPSSETLLQNDDSDDSEASPPRVRPLSEIQRRPPARPPPPRISLLTPRSSSEELEPPRTPPRRKSRLRTSQSTPDRPSPQISSRGLGHANGQHRPAPPPPGTSPVTSPVKADEPAGVESGEKVGSSSDTAAAETRPAQNEPECTASSQEVVSEASATEETEMSPPREGTPTERRYALDPHDRPRPRPTPRPRPERPPNPVKQPIVTEVGSDDEVSEDDSPVKRVADKEEEPAFRPRSRTCSGRPKGRRLSASFPNEI